MKSRETSMTPWELKKFALAEWKEIASAEELEEFERWSEWITAENKRLFQRNRRYRKHIDLFCDIALADGNDKDKDVYLKAEQMSRLGYTPDLLNEFFADGPETIHELFSDSVWCDAVKKLTPRQKQALHCYLTPKTKTSDAALILGTSDRNILKLLATARKNILQEIGATK